MKHPLLIILFLLALSKVHSQQWYTSNLPRFRDVNSIEIFSPGNVLVVGGHVRNDSVESVFQTVNLGLDWDINRDILSYWLKSVDFSDSLKGIAVGYNGKIIASSDGGHTWNSVNSPTNRDLNKIFFTDSLKAFIVGGKQIDTLQTILKTLDGGQTWSVVLDQHGYWLKSICFPNANIGFAVGDHATILKTINGGTSWSPVVSPISRNFNEVAFVSNDTGYIVGGNKANDSIRTILQTTDGGANWTVLKDELGGWLTDISFLTQDTGYIVGDRATFLKTTNGGQAWNAEIVNGAQVDDYFNTVRFYDQNFGIIGGVNKKVFIYTPVTSPLAYTTGADLIDSTQARLKGSIKTFDYPAKYSFVYSKDSSFATYFETAFPENVQSNFFTPVQHLIPGLTPNTTYYYLIKAWSLNGTVFGDTLSFFTGNSGIEFSTLPASYITNSSAQLNGLVKGFTVPVSLFFEYGTTPALGSQVQAVPPSVSDAALYSVTASLSSLQTETTYYFRLKGVSSSGSYIGNILAVSVGRPPFQTLQTLPATNIMDTIASLNGIADGFTIPATLTFEYGIDSTMSQQSTFYHVVNDSMSNAFSDIVHPLIPNTFYFYRLKAETSRGTYYSNVMAFFTNPLTNLLRTAYATDVSFSSVTLTANIKSPGVPFDLSFEYGTTASFGNEVQANPVSVNDTFSHDVSASVSGLQSNTLYYYRVKASTAFHADIFGNVRQFYTGAPTIPNWDFQYWNNDTVNLPTGWNMVGNNFSRVAGHSGNYALRMDGHNIALLGIFGESDPGLPQFFGGVPLHARPDSLSLYLNYFIEPGDTGYVLAYLYKDTNVIAYDFYPFSGNSGGVFRRMSFPLSYNSSLIPDSLVAGLVSFNALSNRVQSIVNSNYVVVDDISFAPATPMLYGDFENWSQYSYNHPDDWVSLYFVGMDSGNVNTTPMVTQVLFNPPSDYAAEIHNVITQGMKIVGQISSAGSPVDDKTPIFPLFYKPISLNGYFKFLPMANDTFEISVSLYKAGQIVGFGGFSTGDSVTQFTPFDLLISYNSNIVPDSGTVRMRLNKTNRLPTGFPVAAFDKFNFDGLPGTFPATHVPEKNPAATFTVFPNPTTSSITIQLENERGGTCFIYDLRGHLIFSNKFTGDRLEVSVADFPRGFYLARIMSSTGEAACKFIVIR